MPRLSLHRAARHATALLVVVLTTTGMLLTTPDGSAAVDETGGASIIDWHAEQPTWVRLVNQVRSLGRAATATGGPLARPTRGIVTSGFGARVVPSFGEAVHFGVDFAAPRGTAVVAAADGMVTAAEHQEAVGNLVVVWHGHTPDGRQVATVYGHLDEIDVGVGDVVFAGEAVGTVGSTGTHAFGPHLHFEVHVDGEPVDPADWL